jgi:hypothetical protein
MTCGRRFAQLSPDGTDGATEGELQSGFVLDDLTVLRQAVLDAPEHRHGLTVDLILDESVAVSEAPLSSAVSGPPSHVAALPAGIPTELVDLDFRHHDRAEPRRRKENRS